MLMWVRTRDVQSLVSIDCVKFEICNHKNENEKDRYYVLAKDKNNHSYVAGIYLNEAEALTKLNYIQSVLDKYEVVI